MIETELQNKGMIAKDLKVLQASGLLGRWRTVSRKRR